jgi:sugar/nucleoside kinase (ribokinase family)
MVTVDLMAIRDSDVTVVGHFAIDSILLPSRSSPFVVLGGSVTYTSFVAKRLDGNVSVISKVGGDFPEAYMWWLRQEGIDLSGVIKLENERTTRFELEYSKDLSSRTLKLKSKASPITLGDLPNSLRAKAVHVAPIAGEISYEVVEHLKGCAEVLSFDPQGLLRSFDNAGNVTCCSPVDKRLLSLINVYKSSLDELSALTGHSDMGSAIKAIHDFGVETVLVTLGIKGAVLSVEETLYNIPPCNSVVVVDPTGAGDVFMGGFLTEYVHQKDSLWCACVGSAAASLVVEGIGPTFFGEKEEIYRRARSIYEKEIKQ